MNKSTTLIINNINYYFIINKSIVFNFDSEEIINNENHM